jgi:hypothetical protein
MKVVFSEQIIEKHPIPNFMKICPVGVELFPLDGWTDMKLIIDVCNFASATNKRKT